MGLGTGNAILDGQAFRLDPTSVKWEFKVKTTDFPTIGGKVVQVYGSEITDMTVSGAFGNGGWDEQERFLARMKALGKKQVTRGQGTWASPNRLIWPAQGWDFLVYLNGFTSVDSQRGSVELRADVFNPKWTLSFFIVEDNLDLKQIAADVFISRIAAGVGWKQSIYNGPMTLEEAHSNLNASHGAGLSGFEAEFTAYGAMAGASAGSTASSDAAPGDLSAIQAEAKSQAAALGWTGAEWDALYELVLRESSWSPTADNPTSTAYGLFQFLDDTWAGTGIAKTEDYTQQIVAGLKYIKSRYTTPSQAIAWHDQHGWY